MTVTSTIGIYSMIDYGNNYFHAVSNEWIRFDIGLKMTYGCLKIIVLFFNEKITRSKG